MDIAQPAMTSFFRAPETLSINTQSIYTIKICNIKSKTRYCPKKSRLNYHRHHNRTHTHNAMWNHARIYLAHSMQTKKNYRDWTRRFVSARTHNSICQLLAAHHMCVWLTYWIGKYTNSMIYSESSAPISFVWSLASSIIVDKCVQAQEIETNINWQLLKVKRPAVRRDDENMHML